MLYYYITIMLVLLKPVGVIVESENGIPPKWFQC